MGLAGDARLIEKLRREELIPHCNRIRIRSTTEVASRGELLACPEHLSAQAGNTSLMTQQLRHTLCDHAAGNYRMLTPLAAGCWPLVRSVRGLSSMRSCICRFFRRPIASRSAVLVAADYRGTATHAHGSTPL